MNAPGCRGVCVKRLPRLPNAFTIIELLVVIMIILVLAGLILGVSKYAQDKGARARAETEIAAMSAALESYKADNGIYVSTANTVALTSASPDPSTYRTASLDLYKALAGDQDADLIADAGTKSYFSFKPQMLAGNRNSSGQLTSVTYLRDPFGNSYGYSTSKNPDVNPNAPSASGNNPTFDLWSTAGPTPTPAPSPIQLHWVKNW